MATTEKKGKKKKYTDIGVWQWGIGEPAQPETEPGSQPPGVT